MEGNTQLMTAGRTIISQSQEWGTPPKYVNAVKEFFQWVISLDPCSNSFSIVKAEVEYSLPYKDGLKESWDYPSIYVNPPYGLDPQGGTSIKNWLNRCEQANRLYHSEVVALVPVATNTGHWKNYVYGKATAICFLYDTRLRFLVNGKDGGKGAPMSCAFIYWGKDYNRFFDIFICYGAVVNIEHLKKIKVGNHGEEHQLELAVEG